MTNWKEFHLYIPSRKFEGECECGLQKDSTLHFFESEEITKSKSTKDWEKEFDEDYLWEDGTYRHEPELVKDFIRQLLADSKKEWVEKTRKWAKTYKSSPRVVKYFKTTSHSGDWVLELVNEIMDDLLS